LPLLVEQILSKLALEMQLNELPRVTARHIEILSQYHWPGNVRELHNVLERSLILWTGAEFNISDPLMVQSDPEWCYTVRYVPGRKLREITDDIEMSLCAEVLRRCDGNKLMAAQLLQISRDTLYRYIRRLRRKFKTSTQDGWLVR
jgi:DNA-binding NtrC family response regulator